MKIERIWAMPNRHTFLILPILKLITEEVGMGSGWLDPFAGWHSPAEFQNDLNPDTPAPSHVDALDFLRYTAGEVEGTILDPPYSISQAKECYDNFGVERLGPTPNSLAYWARVKDELARLVRPSGKAICCGWSSMGLGKSRGFRMTRVLLVPHGGSKNDTIVTVEVKDGVPSE